MTPPPAPPRHPVARRLLLRLAAIGTVLAFLAAAAQLYLEYQRDLDALYARLGEIETSYLPSMRENAWLDDREQLRVLAEGIGNLPDIALVQVVSPSGDILAQAGGPATDPLVRRFFLSRDYSGQPVPLGRLEVTADLETLRHAAMRRVGTTLVKDMVLLTVLAALLYWQVHTLMARRLGAIAAYARRLGRDGPAATPVVTLATPADRGEDEFTDLAYTLSTMHRDLSAAHAALAVDEARYREMFTSSPVPLWEEDFSAVKAALDALPPGQDLAERLDTDPDFIRHCAGLVRILDANDAAIAMHRARDRGELLARLATIFTPSSYVAFRHQLEAIHAGICDLTHETQVRTLDGDVLDVVLHWHVPPSHRHTLSRVIVATEDVSALKAARRSTDITLERLMEANAELERFTYVASHDLQEPVRAVVSFTQLLERRLRGADALPPDVGEFLDYLRAAAQRMQAQVSGLQDYARAGHGSQSAAVDLNDALADARQQLDAALTAVGTSIDVQPLPVVIGDRSQLTLLFRHLLDNAIKFRNLGRPLRITIRAQPQGADWRISVRDNGIGVEPAYAATVFELFRRLHGPGHLPGAGIGLTICRRIVERHGGIIAIDDTVTDGTAVVFTLPAAELVSPPPAASSPSGV